MMLSGRHFRIPRSCLGTPDKTVGKPSANGLIEVPAFGRCTEQGLVHRRGNTEVKVDRLATKLQLQQFSAFVVGNRRERGRLHGGNMHGTPPCGCVQAPKQNNMKMLLSEQY